MSAIETRDAQIAILNCLKRFSDQQFQTYIKESRIEDLAKSQDLSFDHWVASVLFSTTKASVCFRVHFTSSTSRSLLANTQKADPSSVKPTTAQDFLKEYCNVVMGRIKGILSKEVEVDETRKVFLPQVDPSFDEFGIVPTGSEKVVEEAWWRVIWEGGELVVYGRAKASGGFTQDTLEALGQEAIVSLDDEGDIDFF